MWTLTAFVCDRCFLILYWWDKGKLLCSYSISRGVHELLCSRSAFSLCLVLPWAIHEILLVAWWALAMGKTWHGNRGDLSGICQAVFLSVLTYHEERTPVLQEFLLGLAWLSHISCWGRRHPCVEEKSRSYYFIWFLLNLGWSRNTGSVFPVPYVIVSYWLKYISQMKELFSQLHSYLF